jgi:hypothetical protein
MEWRRREIYDVVVDLPVSEQRRGWKQSKSARGRAGLATFIFHPETAFYLEAR